MQPAGGAVSRPLRRPPHSGAMTFLNNQGQGTHRIPRPPLVLSVVMVCKVNGINPPMILNAKYLKIQTQLF